MQEKNICFIGTKKSLYGDLIDYFLSTGCKVTFILLEDVEKYPDLARFSVHNYTVLQNGQNAEISAALTEANVVINLLLLPVPENLNNNLVDKIQFSKTLAVSKHYGQQIITFLPLLKEDTLFFKKFYKVLSVIANNKNYNTIVYSSPVLFRSESIILDVNTAINFFGKQIAFKDKVFFSLAEQEDILKVLQYILDNNAFKQDHYIGSLNGFSLNDIQNEVLNFHEDNQKTSKISFFLASLINTFLKVGVQSFSSNYYKFLKSTKLVSFVGTKDFINKKLALKVLVNKYINR